MRRREFHRASRRRGGSVAARGARAAAERMRRIGVLLPAAADDAEYQARLAAFCRGCSNWAGPIGRNVRIDIRWATANADRHSQTRGGIGRARAGRHPGPWHSDCGAVATGDPHRADRVHDRRRSGRRRLRRQSGAAGRQRHRFHAFRIQPRAENGWSFSRRSRRA